LELIYSSAANLDNTFLEATHTITITTSTWSSQERRNLCSQDGTHVWNLCFSQLL